MLDIAKDYAEIHDIVFNANKCKYLVFGNNVSQSHSIKFNNVIISASSWEKHLGNHLDTINSDIHIKQATNLLYFRFNSIMHKFCSATSDLKYFLFKSYCMALYGCQLWNFESVFVNKFYVAWRKYCRRLLGVPYRTHSDLVHLLCGDEDVDVQLHCRQLKFIKNCIKSENSIVSLCSQLAINGSKSDVSCSINHICNVYNLNKHNLQMSSKCSKLYQEEKVQQAGVIRDLMCMREDILLATEDKSNVSELVEFLCTS